jgi:hypothetical protein
MTENRLVEGRSLAWKAETGGFQRYRLTGVDEHGTNRWLGVFLNALISCLPRGV